MIKFMLASFRPMIKAKLYSLLYQYGHFIKTKNDLNKVKNYLNEIVEEIIKEYSEDNNL